MKNIGEWVITKDHISEGEDNGVIGPYGAELEANEIKKRGKHFKMYDDDDNLYYEGYCIVQDDGIGEEGFNPLENFGTPNAGCSYIKYRNPETNKYEIL